MKLIKLLFSRRWWWATLLVVVGVGVMVRLGFWQLDRLEQRRAANAELLTALRAPAEPLPALLDTVAEPATLADREVTVTGAFDYENQMVLLVQNWQNRAGVHLLTPLLLDENTAVLVDRGWIPEAERDNLTQFNTAADALTVTGYATTPELLRGESVVPDEPQDEWYRVDVPAIAAQLPYDLLPLYVRQAPEDGNVNLPFRAEQVVDLSEGSHLSYAIQWFAFSLMLGVGYLFFVRRNSRETAVVP